MQQPEPTSPATRKAYEAIASSLAEAGVVPSNMFGMPTLKASGKGFAGVFGDSMVFKLSGDAHVAALKLREACLFDPSGAGRPMKEWPKVAKKGPRASAKR